MRQVAYDVAGGDTRRAILNVASDLLVQRGFSAFSYADIAERLGIRKASIHHHFPAKSDLGRALIANYAAVLHAPGSEDPRRALEQFFGGYRALAAAGRICPGGMLQTDLENLSPEMCADLRGMVRGVERRLTAILDAGRRSGDFAFEGTPRHRAVLMLASLQGGLQFARTLGDEKRIAIIVREIKRDLSIK